MSEADPCACGAGGAGEPDRRPLLTIVRLRGAVAAILPDGRVVRVTSVEAAVDAAVTAGCRFEVLHEPPDLSGRVGPTG